MKYSFLKNSRFAMVASLCISLAFSGQLLAQASLPVDPISRFISEKSLAESYAAWFSKQFQEEKLVGGAFAIVSRAGILSSGAEGFTDTSRKQRVDTDTVFRIASVSKTFAAGLTAQLVQDGVLKWDDPVTRYVPGLRIKGDASQIRIQDLLGQSSGLISHAYDNLIEDGVPTDEIFRRLSDLSYSCKPGSCYTYQNSVFSLIQPVVEQVTDSTYEALVDQRIFKPLGMWTASVGYEPFLATRNRAQPHVKAGGQWRTVKVLPNYYRVAPAAGVNASISDMAKWLEAQLGSDPVGWSSELVGNLVLPRVSTPRELHRREWNRLISDAHYGLGWRVYQMSGKTIAYHSGWVSGYRADIAYSPSDGIGITVLLNAESSSINLLTTHFWDLVAQHSKNQAATNPTAP